MWTLSFVIKNEKIHMCTAMCTYIYIICLYWHVCIRVYIHMCMCMFMHCMLAAKTYAQTCLMYETYCWCITPNSVYMQMVIFYHLVEDLGLLVSGCICLTLWSSYVFFCLCCYSLLCDLPSPGSSASNMCRFLLPASSCVQKLDHSSFHLQPCTFH